MISLVGTGKQLSKKKRKDKRRTQSSASSVAAEENFRNTGKKKKAFDVNICIIFIFSVEASRFAQHNSPLLYITAPMLLFFLIGDDMGGGEREREEG